MERYNKKKIPRATAKRLPLYLRNLTILDAKGVVRIKSKELAEITQVPSATIRRDFSYLGELGRSGYGYDVTFLIKVFSDILDSNETSHMAIVGFGNLGKALANNNFRRNQNLIISCVFDTDPEIIGQTIAGFYVYSMEDFERVTREKNVKVAISTVPSEHAQEAIDTVVNSGITAILNFAPDRVEVPSNINMRYIDLTTELLTLLFFDRNYKDTPLAITS
ncbi:redox-sensing transcriptional repressor Rex [Tetragenococcus solitarius]|uniref:Redox-sensing transcriptional repressor Rex n=1 Tax=Tetragenococcus solitarius TaxID=71453 RepID=A0ABP6KIG1_9ENTE|nr:redox-sensing transcriptional repressor Rex [Tetragenococcus solitarius]